MLRLNSITALLAALSWLVAAGSCTNFDWLLVESEQPPFREIVDSLVIDPISTRDEVLINVADLELLHGFLRAEFEKRPAFKTYDEAPTNLPNSVRVDTRLDVYNVIETPGEGIYLRSIDLKSTVSLFQMEAEEPYTAFSFYSTYQRAYESTEDVTSLPFDLRNAMKELAEQIVEFLAPAVAEEPFVPPAFVAEDDFLTEDESHPTLLSANEAAKLENFDRAISKWSVVLFDPVQESDDGRLFYISSRALRIMLAEGMPKNTVQTLEALREAKPSELASFKISLNELLEDNAVLGNRVLSFADYEKDRVHRNLSATHRNLAVMYRHRNRLDLAAYHLSMAYAHNPTEATLEQWATLQSGRALIPKGMSDDDAMALYQKVPPPSNVTVRNGSVDFDVLPEQLEVQVATLDSTGGASSTGTPDASASGELRDDDFSLDTQPVELPTDALEFDDELTPVILVPQS